MACVLPSCRESQKRLDQPCVYGDLKGTYRVDYAGPVDVVAVPNSRHAGGSYVQLGELCSCQVVRELTSRSVRVQSAVLGLQGLQVCRCMRGQAFSLGCAVQCSRPWPAWCPCMNMVVASTVP